MDTVFKPVQNKLHSWLRAAAYKPVNDFYTCFDTSGIKHRLVGLAVLLLAAVLGCCVAAVDVLQSPRSTPGNPKWWNIYLMLL
jgi:hypothetical protein